MKKLHVEPINDLKEHDDSENCHCSPSIELVRSEDGSTLTMLIVHKSYDRREVQEFLEKNLKLKSNDETNKTNPKKTT